MASGVEGEIERLIVPTLEAMGYDLVRVKMTSQGRPTLQVMAERRDGVAMRVEDCSAISRALSAVLDVEDPIAGSYALEVSSPGIDRPLVRREDFTRFAGERAAIEVRHPIAGRRRFKGELLGVVEDCARVRLADGEACLPLDDIVAARLLRSEALATPRRRRR